MDNVKIDILMATYNGEKYIEEQIKSVLAQTYTNFNLYIIDDASSDNTINILKEYEKKDSRIKIFINEQNMGSTNTFKMLLSKVKSQLYMLCDQDDVWNENKIELTYKKMVEENADLIFTDLEVVDESLNHIFPSFNKLKKYKNKIQKFNNINNNFKMIYLYNVITGCTILSKSKYINKILEFKGNKDIIHDHFISLIVGLNGKIVYLDKATIKYRQHTNNQIGVKKYTDRFTNFNDVRQHLIDVKISIFSSYVENEEFFNVKDKIFNKKALEFYKSLKSIKYINFKKYMIFHKLYKHENLIYYIVQYCILNLPFLCKFAYRFKRKK